MTFLKDKDGSVLVKFDVQTVEHDYQRYETVGDYNTDVFGVTHFYISQMSDWRYEFLVAVHEIVEAYLCKHTGVKEEDIDAFDIEYEKNRPEGDTSEPGNSKDAPYYNQHQAATYIEQYLAAKLGVNWEKYDKEVNSLSQSDNSF